MKKNLEKAVHVTMTVNTYEQLKKLSEETSRTLPAYIRQVLKVYLCYQENGLDILKQHIAEAAP